MLEKPPAVVSTDRELVHLVAGSNEGGVAETVAQVIDTLPLAPGLAQALAVLEEVPSEHLLLGLHG